MSASNISIKPPLGKKDVSDQLGLDWHRASTGRKGAFADAIGVGCTETVNNAITGRNVPELHTALNSLLVDEGALFNTFRLFDIVAIRISAQSGDDMSTVCAMLQAVTEYAERLKDGKRDHNDTLALAELLIPLIPKLLAITQEAKSIRGGS